MADERAIEFREKGEILIEFTVLHKGWELDNAAWIIKYQGETELVVTNHGGLYFEDPQFLMDKIGEYQSVISNTQRALGLMQSAGELR
jgi:hypothetical protein